MAGEAHLHRVKKVGQQVEWKYLSLVDVTRQLQVEQPEGCRFDYRTMLEEQGETISRKSGKQIGFCRRLFPGVPLGSRIIYSD